MHHFSEEKQAFIMDALQGLEETFSAEEKSKEKRFQARTLSLIWKNDAQTQGQGSTQ